MCASGDGDGEKKKKKKRESYQSCCQSPGQVVIRTAVRRWLVSVSLTHSHTHTHGAEEKDPVVFTSATHE